MTLVPNASFVLLLVASGLCGIVSLLLWRRRRIPGGGTLALMMLAVCEWTLVAALEAGASELPAKILFSKLEYVGSGSAAFLVLLFALQYAERARWLSGWRLALLGTVPVINLALVFTNDWHHLVWIGFSERAAGSLQIVYHHGPAFYAIVAALYLLVLPATVVLIRTALRRSKVHRRQALAIVAATAAPWIGTALYLARLEALAGFNIIPMSFAVSGQILALSIVGLRHFDVIPIARSALVESMRDPVLVIDPGGAVVDANPIAERVLGRGRRLVGQTASEVFSAWPKILGLCRSDEPVRGEALISEEPLRYVDARVTPLRYGRGPIYGRLIVLRDISLRYGAERDLQQANEQLQDQLDEIERLHEELRDQAIRDPLTELHNRRYLQETLPREIARADRDGAPLALILLDVDRFKQVNDTAGHQAGDAVLRAVGRLLRETTRRGDVACRFGGDEFAVVLPNTSLDAAAQRAEEIRRRLAVEADPFGRATISGGIAVYPQHGSSDEAIVRAADRALYAAKSSGRNTVRTAE